MRNEFLRTLRSLATSRRERWRMATEGAGEFIGLWQVVGGHLRNSSIGRLDSIPNLLEESNPGLTNNEFYNASDSRDGVEYDRRAVGELVNGQTCIRFLPPVFNPNTGFDDEVSTIVAWDETPQLRNNRKWGLALWLWPNGLTATQNRVTPIWVQWTEFSPHEIGVAIMPDGRLTVLLEVFNPATSGVSLIQVLSTEQIMTRAFDEGETVKPLRGPARRRVAAEMTARDAQVEQF